jgi:hypothetical protein
MIPNLVSTAVTAVIPQMVATTRTTKLVPVRSARTNENAATSFLTAHALLTSVTIPVDATISPSMLNPMETIGLNVVT